MTRRLAALGLAVAWGAFAACSSFDADAPSTGDDAGTADSGVDADAAVTADAAEADAEAGPFCESLAPKPTLCADFDDGKPPDFDFGILLGDASVDMTFAKSPPGSLLALTQMNYIERYFPGDAKTITLSYAVRPGGADGGPPLTNFVIVSRIVAGNDPCSFDIAVAAKELEIQAPNPDGGEGLHEDYPLFRYPVAGEWTDVVMRLTDDGTGVTCSVDVGGEVTISPFKSICPNLGSGTRIDMGMIYGGAGNEVRLDNVVFNRE